MSHDAPTVDPRTSPERLVLVVVGGGTVFVRDLPEQGRLKVGRALECDVRIDDPALSRTHVTLVVGVETDKPRPGGDVSRPLALLVESRTGRSRVDGRDVAAGSTVALEPGQIVEIGGSRLVVRRDRERAATADDAARPMEATRRAIGLAAKSELPVLILGETGSGKEVVMENIVTASRRKGGPVVRIQCSAVPTSTLETELFGRTDAEAGLFEAASGGTAFLDEVGDLPLATQASLVRILETRTVTRIGGAKSVPIDVRIVATTHVDVRARVAEGTFREDLYFRLAGIVIDVPPLRQRQDEIAALARAIANEEAAREEAPAPVFSDGALALLAAYRWPGNVRELRNVVVRAMHLASGTAIEPDHLELLPPARSTQSTAPHAEGDAASASTAAPSAPVPGTPEYERSRIVTALERAKGNQKEAARILGMTRRMLMYRLDAYGLPRPRKR